MNRTQLLVFICVSAIIPIQSCEHRKALRQHRDAMRQLQSQTERCIDGWEDAHRELKIAQDGWKSANERTQRLLDQRDKQ